MVVHDIALSAGNMQFQKALMDFSNIVGEGASILVLRTFLLIPPQATERTPILAKDLRAALEPAAPNTIFRTIDHLAGRSPTRKNEGKPLVLTGWHSQFPKYRVVWLTAAGKALRVRMASNHK